MDEFEHWLKANLSKTVFAAEQLRIEAEKRKSDDARAYLRLELPVPPELCSTPADGFDGPLHDDDTA